MATSTSLTAAASPIVSSQMLEVPRSQADPLPPKRGELQYREELHGQTPTSEIGNGPTSLEVLPLRHPADRDADLSEIPLSEATTPNTAAPPPSSPSSTSLPPSLAKPQSSLLSFFTPKTIYIYHGIQLNSLILFFIQTLFLIGTIAAWVIIGRRPQTASASLFIHALFGFLLLGQLVLLERRVFRIRAERYIYLHPGEVLPTCRDMDAHNSDSSGIMSFAPWHRPPLPTYAATLAASGHGTGDVEDNLIAQLPPPAYGNTRGSTLILSGFLRESLRAQRPRSAETLAEPRRNSSGEDQENSPPKDEETRARNVEETLARLEEGSTTTTATNPSGDRRS